AEDGKRDRNVTGVQTCALPITYKGDAHVTRESGVSGQRIDAVARRAAPESTPVNYSDQPFAFEFIQGANHVALGATGPAGNIRQIGRASCRESVFVTNVYRRLH